MAVDSVAIRDYVLLVYLSPLLSSIGSILDDPDSVGIDFEACDASVLLSEMPRSGQIAIERVRELSEDVWRCEVFASAISRVDLKRRVLVCAHEIRDAINQADQPAEMALSDGYADEAIATCADALTRAYDQSGREIKRIAAECSVEASLLFPAGCDRADVVNAFGYCPFTEKRIGTISTVELAELLRPYRDHFEPANEASKITTSTDFRSLRWSGAVYSFTANQAAVVKLLLENWESGTPDVGDETLLHAVDPESPPARLSTLFRDHPAWGAMIVAGGTKGTHRLAEPDDKNT